MADQKSLLTAYILWLVFGIFGGHHFYLRRDKQALICKSVDRSVVCDHRPSID